VRGAFELFVAGRYLRAKRRQAALGVVTVISVAGVAAGVMALVIAIAVNNGFRNSLRQNLLGATPHVVLLEKEPSSGIADWQAIIRRLKDLPGVTQVTPSLYGKVFASGPMQSAEVTLKGVPEEDRALASLLREGSLADMGRMRGLPGIVLGSALARRLGMRPGDVLTLTSPQGELTPLGVRPAVFRFRVAGIAESGFYELDNQYGFTTLGNAQRLFLLGDVVNSIELRLADVDRAPETARAAEQAAGLSLGATHWMEQNRQILGALRLEKTVSLITIGLIQLVAGLNIFTALAMAVMDKRRDIAVLLSLGARRNQIARLFVTQGLLIALAGIVIGLGLGYGLSYLGDHYHWIRLDEEVYSIAYVPFAPRAIDAFWISAAALAVAFVATLQPARAAARVLPVETLRYE
jgi:lipoprotein-releasing system permease protein